MGSDRVTIFVVERVLVERFSVRKESNPRVGIVGEGTGGIDNIVGLRD